MLKINEVNRLYLGCQGENLAQTITIDMSDWLADFPSGIVTVWVMRNGDTVPYPAGATLDRETGTLSWSPTSTDTYVSGEGKAEIRLTVDELMNAFTEKPIELPGPMLLTRMYWNGADLLCPGFTGGCVLRLPAAGDGK